MDFHPFADTSNLQNLISFTRKTARNLALILLLTSFVIPISYMAINTQAQNSNQINLNTKVIVEKVRKNRSKEIKEMTLQEIKSDTELVNFNKFNQTKQVKQTQLNLTPEAIQEIEAKKGVVYENEVAITDQSILTILGYSPAQIELIQNMVDFYNSQTIKSVKITHPLDKAVSKSNFFTVQAQAAPCQNELKFDSQYWWGWRYFMNKCLVDHLEGGNNLTTIAAGVVGGFFVCPIACAILGTYIELHLVEIIKIHKECNENGVFMNLYWSLDVDFSHIC